VEKTSGEKELQQQHRQQGVEAR